MIIAKLKYFFLIMFLFVKVNPKNKNDNECMRHFTKGVATRSKPTIKPSFKPLKVATAFSHFNVLSGVSSKRRIAARELRSKRIAFAPNIFL